MKVTDAMVQRFLTWPLPASVCADRCATTPGALHRTGTNLLSAEEARLMLAHVLAPAKAGRPRGVRGVSPRKTTLPARVPLPTTCEPGMRPWRAVYAWPGDRIAWRSFGGSVGAGEVVRVKKNRMGRVSYVVAGASREIFMEELTHVEVKT